jgi:aspartyl aminopeptidase
MATKKEEKSKLQILKEKLIMEPKNAGQTMTPAELGLVDKFCAAYKEFLNEAKTERESVAYAVKLLEKQGYRPYDPAAKYRPGDKVYVNNRGRSLLFAAIGKKPVQEGARIVASHVDSPRIDLKPRPLYEEAQLALLKTHYYGGIRKHQWVALPLALHGIVSKQDGTLLEINIGEDLGDPCFMITDLLPHLADEQSKRTLSQAIKGEELNVLAGSLQLPDEEDKLPERVKLNVMNILNEKYGLIEADFLSADLSLVPALPARDVGLDRSMIGAYGHDDRVCAYTSLMASLDAEAPETTWINSLADKEETGSDGSTGLQSRMLEHFMHSLARSQGGDGAIALQNSECLSADVSVAHDPTFPDVTERRNTAYLNYGVCVTKYTGHRGKYSTNEATAEFMGKVRRLLDSSNVIWQTGELGKVDGGGGGTVAKYISKLGVDVIDIGVPVLAMHAPFEIVAKTDVYNAYLAFKAFLTQK